MTRVTAAIGTEPPGTIIVSVYAPVLETQRPSTAKPKLRSGSNTSRCGSQCSGL